MWISFQNSFIFSHESVGERIFKIGPHLPKLLSNIKGYTFLGHRVVYTTHILKIYITLSTVPKTLIKMLFNMTMSVLRCNNCSQSFTKLSDCPINEVRQTQTYLLQRILILYRLRVLSLASTFYKHEINLDKEFT